MQNATNMSATSETNVVALFGTFKGMMESLLGTRTMSQNAHLFQSVGLASGHPIPSTHGGVFWADVEDYANECVAYNRPRDLAEVIDVLRAPPFAERTATSEPIPASEAERKVARIKQTYTETSGPSQ